MADMTTTPPALVPASDALADYLAADAVIDHGHPEIRALAARLRGENAEETARAAFAYVRDEIAHSADAGEWSAAYRASDVLATRNSICHGKAHLLAALLRAEGIPTGLCYQKFEVLHGLVAVYWPDSGQWVRIDARGGEPGTRARFATDRAEEQVAWPVDPSLGELDYPTVHPATPPVLLTALAEAAVGAAGYGYLPAEL
jgi:transglutaminase-like putative cysteine protease